MMTYPFKQQNHIFLGWPKVEKINDYIIREMFNFFNENLKALLYLFSLLLCED